MERWMVIKFVKGDGIAGLVLRAINIIAGLIIGVFQKGMTADQAMKTYAIVMIGDGFVSMLPSLLISVPAGVIATRVSSSDVKPLGNDIAQQLLLRRCRRSFPDS
jgi:type III secretion protein V